MLLLINSNRDIKLTKKNKSYEFPPVPNFRYIWKGTSGLTPENSGSTLKNSESKPSSPYSPQHEIKICLIDFLKS